MDVDGLAGGARCVGRRAVDRERASGGIPDAEIDGFLASTRVRSPAFSSR
jgi:hypothetical protein